MKKILLTTPDFPPLLGGLSTFSTNIQRVLQEQGHSVELLVWKSLHDLTHYHLVKGKFDFVINIHFMGGYFLGQQDIPHINFYHGSEILFYSPNPFKRFVKKIMQKKMIDYMQKTFLNLFISQFTLNKLASLGLKENYSRDLVIHNGIDLSSNPPLSVSSLNDPVLNLVCVARDVPHKNLAGTVQFAESLASTSNKKIHLFLTSGLYNSSKIMITNISNIPQNTLEEIYAKAHFNLLLSLDHSRFGFFEGFGLTILEAAKHATPSIASSSGGLPENVHDLETGWIVPDHSQESCQKFWNTLDNSNYGRIAHNCYSHVRSAHSLAIYSKLFQKILIN